MCELIKNISPSLSAAYESAILILPSLIDLTSDPFKAIPASSSSKKKKIKACFPVKRNYFLPRKFFLFHLIKRAYFSASRTADLVGSVILTNGSLTSSGESFNNEAAYFTGDGLLSIKRELFNGVSSLFISSALSWRAILFFSNDADCISEQSLAAILAVTLMMSPPE